MNRVVNFDFPTENAEKAKSFFTDIFGWKFTEWYNKDYWLIETGEKHRQGINGSMIKRRHDMHVPSIMVQVENIDITLKKVIEEGGKINFAKMSIPKVGWMAYINDPENNVVCIMQFDGDAK